jgi:hypothetical protein
VKGWIGLATKDSKARHRARRRAVTFAWPAGGGRHRLRQPSTGVLAVSAVVLAASAASSPVHADPAPTPPAEASADGGTTPAVDFPSVESHLASGRFVGTMPSAVMGSTATIPATVLAAYQRAVERTNMVQPGCHIPLELVAAIGKVESGHARGGRVDATGRTLTPILGPVLSGGAFAAIADTDDGKLDGDPVWDRAVGPMQFIPSTWTRWAADGNVDGTLDPHNVYDASLAAARYLCAANRDLGTPAGLDEAILSYNHSTSYLSLVRSWMAVYRNGTVSVDDIVDSEVDPLTVTSSPPPPPTTTPPSTPPTTPPPTTPPPTTPPPTTPPDTSTPPDTPTTTPPAPTGPPEPTGPVSPPNAGADSGAVRPPGDAAGQEPDQCVPAESGLVDGLINGVVGGLVGETPECAPSPDLPPQAPTPPAMPTP